MRWKAAPAKTILLVEDNDVIREGLAVVLRSAGYAVQTAVNGTAAMDRLRSGFRPNLILLDMMMRGEDGWSFMIDRHREPSIAAVPVVIVTALGIASEPWAASMGAVGLIRKPIETVELLSEVAKVLSDVPG
jgi:two-component system, chemotaxis family, chemotaxis protein CheY